MWTLLGATYWGGAACAPPQYVADQHAAIQSPVTIGEGNTGKPALDEIPDSDERSSPAVHPVPGAVHSPSKSAASPQNVGSSPGAAAPNDALPPEVAAAIGGQPESGSPAAPETPDSFDPRQTPDPEPATTDAYYELTLRYCERSVHLLGAKRVALKRPSTLPSLMGRFAAELWIGHELLERARFEFPGVAADTLEKTEPPSIELGTRADVVWKVKVADRVRATQAWIIDRATGERWLLTWPPEIVAPKPTADAPCPSFGGK